MSRYTFTQRLRDVFGNTNIAVDANFVLRTQGMRSVVGRVRSAERRFQTPRAARRDS